MTTEVAEPQVFPYEIGGKVVTSIEELEEHIAGLRKEARGIIREAKGGRKGRAKSPRRLFTESVIADLNQNYVMPLEVREKLEGEGNNQYSLSFRFNVETQEFYLPVYQKGASNS